MKGLKTLGIVLKSTNFGEADKILTVFTERLGKVKVIAKGVRKIRSHLAGTLEPFMILDLQLHEGKTFFIVTGGLIKADFPSLRDDLNKIAKAFFLGELVDRFLEEEQKASELFNLFSEALSEVDGDLSGPLIEAFMVKILSISGFKPELHNCIYCKNKITPENNYWSNNNGGLVCANCASKNQERMRVSDQAIKMIRFLFNENFSLIAKLKIGSDVQVEVELLIKSHIERVLERELKSQRFLRTIGKI